MISTGCTSCSKPQFCFLAYLHIRINRGDGRKVFKAVVQRGMKVHRSVLTRLEALTTEEQPRGYIPRIRPNIVCDEGLPHERRVCRALTHEEWLKGGVEDMPTKKPLFEWV
jgi:hypothetical protein